MVISQANSEVRQVNLHVYVKETMVYIDKNYKGTTKRVRYISKSTISS